jgi:2'-5' RNA ligase
MSDGFNASSSIISSGDGGRRKRWEKLPNKETVKTEKKATPNHFICLRLNHAEMIARVSAIQDSLVAKDHSIKSFIYPSFKLHVTVGVMSIGNDVEKQAAVDALQDCHPIVTSHFKESPLTVHLRGLSSFGQRVLYVNVHAAALQAMGNDMRCLFMERNVMDRERTAFVPHVTLLKTSMVKGRGGRISKECWEGLKDVDLGTCVVRSVDLVDMQTKGPDGFFRTVSSISIGPATIRDNCPFAPPSMARLPASVHDAFGNLVADKR